MEWTTQLTPDTKRDRRRGACAFVLSGEDAAGKLNTGKDEQRLWGRERTTVRWRRFRRCRDSGIPGRIEASPIALGRYGP
ncbi:hypothetical protein BVIET440_450002 [Burkholderia vietnamiensis]|nr:hypothetical protein BVI1335_2130027 [Burkholderia vietnamiensis]